jgi:hypothetical protein
MLTSSADKIKAAAASSAASAVAAAAAAVDAEEDIWANVVPVLKPKVQPKGRRCKKMGKK